MSTLDDKLHISVSRRRFLAGVTALGAGAVAAACSGGGKNESTPTVTSIPTTVFIPSSTPVPRETPHYKIVPSSEGFYLGVFTQDVSEPTALKNYIQKTGHIPSFFQIYANLSDGIFPSYLNPLYEAGSVPLITLMPKKMVLDDILQGKQDHNLAIKWANQLKKLEGAYFLRIAQEPNGNWDEWSGANNGGGQTNGYGNPNIPDGPERYVNMFRYVRDFLTNEGVHNATYVWTPNRGSVPDEAWNAHMNYYPGDDYVDWVGATTFNFGTSESWSHWESFARTVSDPYAIVSVTGKPFMLAEYASVETGGDKAKWLDEHFVTLSDGSFPLMRAAAYSDYNFAHDNTWRLDSSPAAFAAWKRNVETGLFSTKVSVVSD